MTAVRLENIHKSFGATEVLHGINLEIKEGEFIVFVGPSGCGKSTLLRLIAGLEDISSGTMSFDGDTVNHLTPSERGIAMVFQSYALYPHMTVFDNMAFGMKLAKGKGSANGGGKSEIESRVREAAEILQITPYLDRLPKQLSGGQRQRVAIGRAIVRDPKVFLFDEPLSNLDAALRVQTRIEIAKLHERMAGTTMVYVTHDQVEAMTLADRIVVLRDGNVEQVGTPMELYKQPANLFVAQFIGSPAMNILPASAEVSEQSAKVTPAGANGIDVNGKTGIKNGKLLFGVRPEDLMPCDVDKALFTAKVSLVEKLGENQLVYLELEEQTEPLVAKLDGDQAIKRGDTLSLTADVDKLRLFTEDGAAIGQ